jgi:chaperone required for assembly of F1-ATPase
MAFLWQKIEEKTSAERDDITSRLADYALSDVLLFISDQPDLRQIQEAQRMPLFQVLKDKFGLNLQAGDTLEILPENHAELAKLPNLLLGLNSKLFAAVYVAGSLLQSVLSALLLAKGEISAKEAFEISYAEELYQRTRWGDEPISGERLDSIRRELEEIEDYLRS